jgi:hypothetical protein
VRAPTVIVGLVVLFGILSAPGVVPDADAAPVALRVRMTATCPQIRPLVRLADGSTARVAHADPGPTLRRVTSATRNLFVVMRVAAPWGAVKRAPGHVVQVTAGGPRGEQWRWRYAIAARNPERDTSNYVVCLRPLTTRGSFASHLKTRPGRWTFTVQLVTGRFKGSRGASALTVG